MDHLYLLHKQLSCGKLIYLYVGSLVTTVVNKEIVQHLRL